MTGVVLAFHVADDEDELEYCILSSYYMYWMFRCFVFSGCYVVRLVVLTIQMFVSNYYEVLLMRFHSMKLHYIYSIVFCPCAVSNTIDSVVLPTLTIVHGRLTHFTAHFL